MAMDFFEHQDAARRQTGLLVVLFALAVLGIMVLTYLAVAAFLIYVGVRTDSQVAFWDWRIFAGAGTATSLIVGGGSLYKLALLRSGGSAVAESLGGRLLDTGNRQPAERQLLNVVQEMAIASGTPVPQVYVMDDEHSINAFAAGYQPGDAVIGVTRGCMNKLSRDELQGVIAHEFSHILNGDMRLNIKLIGVVHGIVVIGLLGWALMRSAFYTGGAVRRRNNESGGLPLLAFGGALCIIGFVGTFFGNLIKAAVSRQREYLADASAVQFTRNPEGIAGALKKIGGYVYGSRMGNPRAPEISHMLFGQGFKSGLTGLFATHPPLPERIRRIDHRWDGRFPDVEADAPARPGRVRQAAGAAAGVTIGMAAAAEVASQPANAMDRIGQPGPDQVRFARQILARLPERLRDAARDPHDARALVYAFLLSEDRDVRRRQLERLEGHADHAVYRVTGAIWPLVADLDPALRLPLIEMSMAALREMSPNQYDDFQGNVAVLIREDDTIDLFEWILRRIIIHDLEPHFTGARRATAQYYSLVKLVPECAVLVSALARAGHASEDAARRSFDAGASRLGVPGAAFQPPEACTLHGLDKALAKLTLVTPKLKKYVVMACAACIAADREITVEEGELFRAVGAALGVPIPPLMPGQPLV